MDDNRLFGPLINTAAKSLDLRARRHDIIISNIANADTPGYKAFDVLVDEALAKQAGSGGSLPLQRTSAGHIPGAAGSTNAPKPVQVEVPLSVTLRGDGNTVDMDREMSNLSANQLMYKASAQILSKKLQGLRTVIQGGKR